MTAVYCDAEVMRFIPGGALHPSAVPKVLDKHRADNESDLGFYAVEERLSGEVIGEVGFSVFETGEREIGWTFARAFWGRGFASEAVRACLGAVAVPVVAAIDAENVRSVRVAEKAGMRLREERELHGRSHLVYELG